MLQINNKSQNKSLGIIIMLHYYSCPLQIWDNFKDICQEKTAKPIS